MGENFNHLIQVSTQKFGKYPLPCNLTIRVPGYLFIEIGVKTAPVNVSDISPLPCKLGSRELVCKVNLVQFPLKYTQVHV